MGGCVTEVSLADTHLETPSFAVQYGGFLVFGFEQSQFLNDPPNRPGPIDLFAFLLAGRTFQPRKWPFSRAFDLEFVETEKPTFDEQ
jgi:hypothetical protein